MIWLITEYFMLYLTFLLPWEAINFAITPLEVAAKEAGISVEDAQGFMAGFWMMWLLAVVTDLALVAGVIRFAINW